MIVVSRLIELACRIGGPRFTHDMKLRRMERWRTFEPEYFLLDHLADPSRAAVDVGANEGMYAGRLAQLCPRVHCFEPLPWMAADLRAKLHANVTVHEAAVSDRSGSGELRVPYRGETQMHGTSTIEAANALDDSTDVRTVPCRLVTLDATISEPVGFIKVDVEGHELAVLHGAAALILRDRPTLLVESEKRHSPEAPESIFAFMASLGYGGCFLLDGRPRALSAFDAHVHQPVANLAGGTRKVGTYINNFIFVPGALPR